MCGIAGQIALESGADIRAETLQAMSARLLHRGPDDSGVFIGSRAGFAFRRLATIDLATGHQPMQSADLDLTVVFNGEIYNHRELRLELEARGHHFRTRSDTEVLLYGWREWGRALPERLNGMFAFAVWSESKRTAFLARDRLGKKPLCLGRHADSLWFASELKALWAVEGWTHALDFDALDIYLTAQSIPAPFTIFRDVEKLPPASWLEVRDGRIERGTYWSARFEPKFSGDRRELATELERRLSAAVERRLESEVPLGAFLSGGVDSACVVALASRALGRRLSTYTIGFEESEFDEREAARSIAERFGTEHHEFVVRPDVVEDLPAIVGQYDEPFADKSAVPSWYVAREAARELTVVLTGDGGDDLFAGYDKYRAPALGRWLARGSNTWRAPLEEHLLEWLLEPQGWRSSLGRHARQKWSPLLRSLVARGFFQEHDKTRLLRADLRSRFERGGLPSLARRALARTRELQQPLDRMLKVDLELYLASDLLPKLDIATMAHSLEARSPFLDREVLEFALRLPDRARVDDGETKCIVKDVARSLAPERRWDEKKRGFSVPVDRWLAGPLAEMLRELVIESPRALPALFEPREVRRLFDEHVAGTRLHGGRLWALLCFELWFRRAAECGAAPKLD